MIFGVRKLRVPGISCCIICVILCLAVLIQYQSVTDRHTHTETDRHMTMAYTAIAKHHTVKNLLYAKSSVFQHNKIGCQQ